MLAVANELTMKSKINWENMVQRLRLLRLCAEVENRSRSIGNPLLMAHYADCHRGVAIEFDASSKVRSRYFKRQGRSNISDKCRARIRGKDFIEDALGLKSLLRRSASLPAFAADKVDRVELREGMRIVRVASEEPQGLFTDLPFCPRALTKNPFGLPRFKPQQEGYQTVGDWKVCAR